MNERPFGKLAKDLRKALVAAYVRSCDYSPTIREIAEAVGGSVAHVHRQVELLEAEGRIVRVGPTRRIVVRSEEEGA